MTRSAYGRSFPLGRPPDACQLPLFIGRLYRHFDGRGGRQVEGCSQVKVLHHIDSPSAGLDSRESLLRPRVLPRNHGRL